MESKIIIIGKAASGKDYLQKQLVLKGWKPLKQYTTRPRRPTENGDEYHFVSEDEFDSIRHKLMSVQIFNGWKYGFDIDEALESDVMIFSPANFSDIVLGTEKDVKCLEIIVDSNIVYIDIDENTRRERLSKRYIGGSEDDSLERRLKADANDFEFFDSIDWDNDPTDRFIRLCNNVDVDNFLKKIFS